MIEAVDDFSPFYWPWFTSCSISNCKPLKAAAPAKHLCIKPLDGSISAREETLPSVHSDELAG
jgi:hypothetical protein